MTKKIFRSIFLATLVVFVASLALTLTGVYWYFNTVQQAQLREQSAMVARGVDQGGAAYLEMCIRDSYEGESVFDLLQREMKQAAIHMEYTATPIYNSSYIEGIGNLYELDCGPLSGWMYQVNGWYPNYGSSRYQLQQDDVVIWRYTCDLGQDLGTTFNQYE